MVALVHRIQIRHRARGHLWIFIFTPQTVELLARRVGQLSASPDCAFHWRDAAAVMIKARRRLRQLGFYHWGAIKWPAENGLA